MSGAAIAATAAVIGTGISAYGTMQQGKTANAIAGRNAQIMNRNADIAKQNAEFNAKLEERDSRRKRAKDKLELGNGVEIYDGTNLIAMATQEWSDETNAEMIRRGGQNEANNLRMKAGVTIAEGEAAESAGMVAAGGSLLTGFGNAALGYKAAT